MQKLVLVKKDSPLQTCFRAPTLTFRSSHLDVICENGFVDSQIP